MTFYFRFKKCHFTKDFIKNFEFDVKSPFFLFFSEFSRKSSFCGEGGGGIKFEFFGVLVGDFNFRPGTYNVPPGSSAPSLKRPKAWRARSASLMVP